MSKTIKISSIIGMVVVVLVVAGIAILKSIDFNQYKEVIAEQAKAATGRDLTIAGDLTLSISLTPRVSVNDVTFANASWGTQPDMVSIRHFAAEMSLISLLSGDIKINQVVLEGVDMLAEKDKSGKANWDFDVLVTDQKATPAGGDAIVPLVSSVRLKDVNVTYRDAQAGQEYVLKLATVDLRSAGINAPLDLMAEGAINSQTFTVDGKLGSIAAVLEGNRPVVDVVLKMDTLNFDELLPKEDIATTSAPVKNGEDRVFPDDPLPLDGLMAADAKIKFYAGKIIVDGMDVSDVNVTLSLDNGRLTINPLGAVIAGGKLNGSVLLDASGKAAELKATVAAKQIDYGQLLTQRGLGDIATGKLDLSIDVLGSGGSVRQIMAGLNGKARLATKNGKLESGALNIVSTDLLNVFDSKDDKTIRCGVMQFNIIKGMANAHAIVFETGGLSVVGTGSANLADESLKLRIDPRSKKANLATVAMVPVNVIGTFAKPDWKVDMADAAENVAAGAARTAGAVATMGLSLLVEKAANSVMAATDDTDYCTPALAGEKIIPGEMKAVETPQKQSDNSSSPPAAKQESSGALDSIGKSLGSGLKGLLGK